MLIDWMFMGFKYRIWRSFEQSVSFTLILLLDILDLHQNDSLGSADENDSSGFADCAL